MPTTYTVADDSVRDTLNRILSATRRDLLDAGVTIALLEARAPTSAATGEPTGPALSHGGYPAAALVRVNSLRDRVEGKADATIILDAEAWGALSDGERMALIDHEVTHLELVLDEESSAPTTDDAGRPKLKLRKHDFVLGGFRSVVDRYGPDSLEWRELCRINRDLSSAATGGAA